jgi:predicted GNAT family acetyltransferase
VLVRIRGERLWFWDDDGPVHLTGSNVPAYGVVRVGPVFTPKQHRSRGYAGAAVAEVSRRIVAGGARACLFTDQANPTSNRLYETLGYRRVVDMANLRVETPGE